MKHIKLYEDFINESGKYDSFEKDIKLFISHIEDGYGWIDPDFVEDTYLGSQKEDGLFRGIPYNKIKQELYKRLIDADILYYAGDEDGEYRGKKVTSIPKI